MEEKVQYQTEEQLRDFKEHIQGLETKVTSMEHQQQQYLIDNLDGTNARAVLLTKLLSTVVGIVHIILFFLSTLLRSTPRAVISVTFAIIAIVGYYKQDFILAQYYELKDTENA